ncbi:hypothetical protein ACQPWY_27055 [Pseudonocardia xinjiangensis]|uniref:hypothetical protein n=1 Tax=Pseudonocardia xinjiangensis TaxID=75289 RepID=UPI003D93C504
MGKPVEVLTADKAESPAGRREYVGPRAATEQLFAEVLADVAELNRVSVDSHFFADLGLNAGSRIQCHSQEDGAFKSDRITIGAGCTLGTSSLVHYGVTMGAGSELAPDAFLMKGEEIPQRARWAGNPAREMPEITTRA